MSEDVIISGPLFDGMALIQAEAATLAARHAVAEWGKGLVQAAFNSAIQQNTGKFLMSVQVIDQTQTFRASGGGSKTYTMTVAGPAFTEIVTTSMASYGPWLEGVGSRNSTTRFKGYWGFRNAAQQLELTADAIAEMAIEPYVARMNL